MTPLSIDIAPERGMVCGAAGKVVSFSIASDSALVLSASEDMPSEGASVVAIR